MLADLKTRLSAVRQRQRLLRSIHWSTFGWLIGAVVAIVMALIWRADLGLSWWTPLATIIVTGGIAWMCGFVSPLSWHQTASSVDNHYDLKDRSSTALQFAANDQGDPIRKLQISDALERLQDIDPLAVAPWQTPRPLFASVGATLVMALVMLVPINKPRQTGVSIETRQALLEQADYLDETMIEELHDLAEENEGSEEIKKLADKLQQLVEELRDESVDEREALAKLSTMQQSIAETMAQFNLEQVDSALQSLASAVESSEAMQPLAADLRAGDYDNAAEKLEKFVPNQLSNKETRAVSGNLKKLSSELSKAKQAELSDAASEMCEGMEKKDDSQCKDGACKLAAICKKQGLRKSLCKGLCSQLNRLSLCKSQCQGNKNGGKGTAKSDSPRNTWGSGESNRPLGDQATKLDSSREQVEVNGVHGEGPSEKEVITSPEAEQTASRDYQKKYKEFRKRAEAVLDSEPLPLGHRQTVRRYFENIRPTDETQ